MIIRVNSTFYLRVVLMLGWSWIAMAMVGSTMEGSCLGIWLACSMEAVPATDMRCWLSMNRRKNHKNCRDIGAQKEYNKGANLNWKEKKL
jgi:hypothetical protein